MGQFTLFSQLLYSQLKDGKRNRVRPRQV